MSIIDYSKIEWPYMTDIKNKARRQGQEMYAAALTLETDKSIDEVADILGVTPDEVKIAVAKRKIHDAAQKYVSECNTILLVELVKSGDLDMDVAVAKSGLSKESFELGLGDLDILTADQGKDITKDNFMVVVHNALLELL